MPLHELNLAEAQTEVGINPDHRRTPLLGSSLLRRAAKCATYPCDSGAHSASSRLPACSNRRNPKRPGSVLTHRPGFLRSGTAILTVHAHSHSHKSLNAAESPSIRRPCVHNGENEGETEDGRQGIRERDGTAR